MKFDPDSSFLNRFTSLPVVLDMLSKRKITLLPPTSWEDRNDTYYLNKYISEKKLKTLLVACFTTSREQFHHWKIFAGGLSGVCVEFKTKEFLDCFRNSEKISFKAVSYKIIKYNQNPSLGAWPFLKRHAYKDEAEFRIIYEDKHEETHFKSFDIELNCIGEITLSPWLSKTVAKSVGELVHRIDGCDKIPVHHSTLLESKKWQECIWAPK